MNITIYNLDKFTAQEVFDKVANHLLTQNKKSIDEGLDECLYRSPDGLKCAIGCLIPDDMYKEEMEGAYIHFRAKEEHEKLLRELQQLHDRKHPKQWRTALAVLATKHKLSVENLT